MPVIASYGMQTYVAARFRGVLLGTFLGDALGRPFEGTPLGDLSRLENGVDGQEC